MSVFAARLVQVQGFQSAEYAARASKELLNSAVLPATRGEITDVNGVVLARSVDAINVTADQTLVTDPAAAAKVIAPILGIPDASLQATLTGTRRFVYVAKAVTPQVWLEIQQAISNLNSTRSLENRISGFFPEKTFRREYPSGPLAASILGFVNASGHGGGGLEYALDKTLAGTDGSYIYDSGGGAAIPSSSDVLVPAKQGQTIRLTIDRDIEWIAQSEIDAQVKASGALSGTAIVMDPNTGAILALASSPSYDPNNVGTTPIAMLGIPAVDQVYEPGSTGKVMTLSAALEEKAITPTTIFRVPYKIKRGGRTFHDDMGHPLWHLTTAGILARSSNVGAIQIGEKMSNATLRDYLTRFGIGSVTGVGLPGESPGLFPALDQWSQSTAETVAFGQGYALTSLQATSVFATVANDGVRIPPTLIAGISDSDGHYTAVPPKPGVRVISAATAKTMRLMMEGVVSSGGTAPEAEIPGYRVAGKTGTANRVDSSCSCYRGYTASFIGFAPADKPALVMSVTIQDPKGIHFGGLLGAPIFKKVISFALKSLSIPPTGRAPSPIPLDAYQLKQSLAAKPTPAVTP
ncbi:MAG TPA: penicillin-binding protein 2 [Candidatus Nanopelagicaceae bacterium]|nr:penicillin-binding protein 2 [Candidatus Nanopelagicaceae bacterium]